MLRTYESSKSSIAWDMGITVFHQDMKLIFTIGMR